MEEKELKKQLSEAKKKRNNGEFAEALAILHQVNNEFPQNVTYRYLLASTYYESMNAEAAKRYVEEAIELDGSFKENYELLGDIFEKEGNLKKAAEFYEKAFAFDHQYLSVSEKLIQLYITTENYAGVMAHCNTIMSYIPVDVSTAKARALTSIYLSCVLYKGWALVYLNNYEDAVKEISRRKELYIDTKAPIYPRMFKDDDEALYKLYIKLNDLPKVEEYKGKLISEYNYTGEQLEKLQAEAAQGIFLVRQRP